MLEITDLHKRYDDVVALDGCTFEVQPGRMLGFLGPNGAGKTTAMRSIFGLVQPDRGEIRWKGEPVTHEMRMRFGYIPEQRGLYPKMKAHDQLTYMGRLHGMEKKAAAAAADTWLELLGLADRRDTPTEALSHGNQQRVQLAAALVHDPDLMVLDEPLSGLDPLGVDTMAEVLQAQADAGKAVMFSSHQLDLVEDLCDDVAIINRGRIVAAGNVNQLKNAASIRHLELEIEGPVESVLASLEGVRSADVVDGRHVLIVEAATDVRKLLAEAERGGIVHHFVYTTPSLTDLFREAVA
ncbi:MAG TPA: ATP-binding cassette domain-containing protein [Acidimicrobiia bacterium]|nr:ATP-binding cassette domain-containing protein [Acidimicrobiia bacterium]